MATSPEDQAARSCVRTTRASDLFHLDVAAAFRLFSEKVSVANGFRLANSTPWCAGLDDPQGPQFLCYFLSKLSWDNSTTLYTSNEETWNC